MTVGVDWGVQMCWGVNTEVLGWIELVCVVDWGRQWLGGRWGLLWYRD